MNTISDYMNKAQAKFQEYKQAKQAVDEAYEHICTAHDTGKGMTEALEEYNLARDKQHKAFRSTVRHTQNLYKLLELDVPKMVHGARLEKALVNICKAIVCHRTEINEYCKLMNK